MTSCPCFICWLIHFKRHFAIDISIVDRFRLNARALYIFFKDSSLRVIWLKKYKVAFLNLPGNSRFICSYANLYSLITLSCAFLSLNGLSMLLCMLFLIIRLLPSQIEKSICSPGSKKTNETSDGFRVNIKHVVILIFCIYLSCAQSVNETEEW